jgi:hypothetical protein
MKTTTVIGLALAAALSFTACSKKTETAAPAAPAAPEAPQAAPPPASSVAAPPAASTVAAAAAAMARTAAPAGAKVYFVGIKNGDAVTSPFKLAFGVDALKVAPAGTAEAGTGHHHLIIDADLPPQGAPLPADDHVKHFGKGQTETELTLPAGTHTLQLEFADLNHVPFDPPVVSEKITITVK